MLHEKEHYVSSCYQAAPFPVSHTLLGIPQGFLLTTVILPAAPFQASLLLDTMWGHTEHTRRPSGAFRKGLLAVKALSHLVGSFYQRHSQAVCMAAVGPIRWPGSHLLQHTALGLEQREKAKKLKRKEGHWAPRLLLMPPLPWPNAWVRLWKHSSLGHAVLEEAK